eukprot:scaffold4427_cov417-Prasinococcus_capsulatus_cf.AAC.1
MAHYAARRVSRVLPSTSAGHAERRQATVPEVGQIGEPTAAPAQDGLLPKGRAPCTPQVYLRASCMRGQLVGVSRRRYPSGSPTGWPRRHRHHLATSMPWMRRADCLAALQGACARRGPRRQRRGGQAPQRGTSILPLLVLVRAAAAARAP